VGVRELRVVKAEIALALLRLGRLDGFYGRPVVRLFRRW
jgi:hypothetical protein